MTTGGDGAATGSQSARSYIGFIVGAAIGLVLGLWDYESLLCETVPATLYGALCGTVVANKTKQPLGARSVCLGALVGGILFVGGGWLTGTLAGIEYIRIVIGGMALGAVIGSEPKKAAHGAKTGGGVGLALGLLLGLAYVIIKGVPVTTTVGFQSLQITAPLYVVLYASLAGVLLCALVGALMSALPRP